MELILLTIILILLFANLCVALMKNNRKQNGAVRVSFPSRNEGKPRRDEPEYA